MSSASPCYTVRQTSDTISGAHIKAYRALMEECELVMAADRRCSQPDGSILLKTNPGRICVSQSRTSAQRFADQLAKRTQTDWIVIVDPDESTAHHEAGHAVAAVAMDRPIGSISICGGDGFKGKHELPGLGDAWDDPIRKERDIIVRLAGYAAQARHERRAGQQAPTVAQLAQGAVTTDGGFLSDGGEAYLIVDDIATDSDQAVRVLADATEALLAVAVIASAVDAVADRVLDSPTGMLTGEEIRQIAVHGGVVPQAPIARWTPQTLWK